MKSTQGNSKERIVRIPGVLGGKPVIQGTRIPVDMILERLAFDLDLKTLFEDYPDLTEEEIKACIAYAKSLFRKRKSSRPTIYLPSQHTYEVSPGVFRPTPLMPSMT
jgi:uncharacterized protein (DUF433 family)